MGRSYDLDDCSVALDVARQNSMFRPNRPAKVENMTTSAGRVASCSAATSLILNSTRAAALDNAEPTGKSPGRGAEFVAGKNGFLPELPIVSSLLTGNRCCAHSLHEPVRQIAISRVGFQLPLSHAVK